MHEAGFELVIEQGIALQRTFPELQPVAVGGTAAALHCQHRFSMDVDCVTPLLSQHYDQVAEALEHWEGWRTNRKTPPLLILGERGGVQLGLRQQRREAPLRTMTVQGLRVPTPAETLVIKAFLMQDRRATRDYLDVAALADLLGEESAARSLSYLNLVYPAGAAQTTLTRFAEASEADPADLVMVDLRSYKSLRAPFTDWSFVAEACRKLGHRVLKWELTGELPRTLDAGYSPTQV
jgi:hypothetical protein